MDSLSHSDFSGVGEKIRRAQRQTADLDAAMKDWMDGESYVIDSERDPQTGHYVYSVPKLPTLDPQWPVIVGEILFDLRSALDHFAWQLVVLDSDGTPGKDTNFPIKDTPFNDKGKLNIARIRPALKDPKLIAAVEEAQPYNGMDGTRHIDRHPLQRLSLLNNWDKHRLLLLAVQVLDLGRVFWAGNESDPQPAWWFEKGALRDGSPVALFDFGTAERPPHFNPNLELQVAIEEPLTTDGTRTRLTPLMDLLKDLEWGVVQLTLADKFAHLLPASAIPEVFPNMRSAAGVPPVKGYM